MRSRLWLLALTACQLGLHGAQARRLNDRDRGSLEAIADSIDALAHELEVFEGLRKGRHARRWFATRRSSDGADTPASEHERQQQVIYSKSKFSKFNNVKQEPPKGKGDLEETLSNCDTRAITR